MMLTCFLPNYALTLLLHVPATAVAHGYRSLYPSVIHLIKLTEKPDFLGVKVEIMSQQNCFMPVIRFMHSVTPSAAQTSLQFRAITYKCDIIEIKLA